MKTINEIQSALDAIRAVCNQHGVVLLGVCRSEGIYSEIDIIDAAYLTSEDAERVTNSAEITGQLIYAYTTGIGN